MKGHVDIAKIYDDYSVRLYNIGLRIVGDASDAEEIMHDTLLKFLSYQKKDRILSLDSWLASICIRKAVDRLRAKHRYKDFLTRYAEMDPGEDYDYEEPEDVSVEDIRKALAELPDGISLKEKSEILNSYYNRKYAALENLMTQYMETL